MPENVLKDVFVSYSSDDRWFVEPVVTVLKQRGLRVYFDQDTLPGERWFRVLEEALRSSQVTVIFITPNSLRSGWVDHEMEGALRQAIKDKARYVIPVLLQGTTAEQLPSFLQSFRALDRSRADLSEPDVKREIGETLAELIKELIPGAGLLTLSLPFVVFAMKRHEAEDLLTGKVPVSAREADKFTRLVQELAAKDHTAAQLLEFYSETRDEWRSPLCSTGPGAPRTIRETIEEVVGRINQLVIAKEASGYILHPQYFSEDFTSEEYVARNHTYVELSQRGCVLIVDSLALFHPTLRSILDESGLAQPKSKTVPIVAPLPYCRPVDPIDELLEGAMKMMMARPFFRFDTELDMLCEFGVGHPRTLKRWLFSVLPMAAEAIYSQRPSANQLKIFREQTE